MGTCASEERTERSPEYSRVHFSHPIRGIGILFNYIHPFKRLPKHGRFGWVDPKAEWQMTNGEIQIGNYKLTRRVGSGGMGTVFRAVDSSGNHVAIKVIGSKTAIDATIHVPAGRRAQIPPALDTHRRMMFVREARVAMELSHPNITRVFDYGQHEGLLYIVMEFLNGRPLDKVVPLYAAISLSTRIALIRQLCEALSYAHRQGVIHRDIKPPNCFVIENSVLKVLDFGIAARADQPPSPSMLLGTFTHMAPELFAGSPRYAVTSDIWAAGVTFYQLLTGRLPFAAPSVTELVKSITQMPFLPLSESLPCSTELGRIVNRALAKDPASRYAAAEHFARDLANVEAALNAASSSLEGENAKPNGASVWWAKTVFQETALTSPVPVSTAPEIAQVSGGVRLRRSGSLVRLAEYNARILMPELIGMLLAGSYAIFSMLGGDGYASWQRWAWMFVAYVSGILVPVLLMISALLCGLAIAEKLAEVSWCRRCKAAFFHRSRVTTYAYSKVSWRHASSDCLAALKENLWDDAPKLLAMHGELVPPVLDTKTEYPPLRLHLDFYSCQCGDALATLTTDDRIGRTWNTREEYAGAYKTQAMPERGPSIISRLAGLVKAMARAVRLAVEPIPPRLSAMLIVAGLFIVFEYWPQYPIILGKKSPATVIQSDPPGVGFTTGAWTEYRFTSPRSFRWAFRTTHVITCNDSFVDNQNVYRFSGVTPKPDRIDAYPPDGPWPARHNVIVSVDKVLKDRWGRLTTNAATPAYTIKYVVIGKRDFMAEARAQAKSDELQKQAKSRNVPDLLPYLFPNPVPNLTPNLGRNRGLGNATRATIVVTSNPPGLAVVVDGVRVVTPHSYNWEVGSGHVLVVPEGGQVLNGSTATAGQVYTDGRWDSGTRDKPREMRINWSAIPFPFTYTAKFRALPPPESQSRHSSGDK